MKRLEQYNYVFTVLKELISGIVKREHRYP